MKNIIRKTLAAMGVMMLMLIMSGCNKNNNEQYEYLKTDIIGIWCDEAGPEFHEYFGEDGEDYSYYSAYEFTSDGTLCYHNVYPFTFGSTYKEASYSIEGNILDVDGAKCRIDVRDGILTMTNDETTTTYRKMDIPEIAEYLIDPAEPAASEAKESYISSCWDDYNATAAPGEEYEYTTASQAAPTFE